MPDLKFADIPNGIQALYKMPAEADGSKLADFLFRSLISLRYRTRFPSGV